MKKHYSEIFEKCTEIALGRQKEYGDIKDVFKSVSTILKEAFDLELEERAVCKVLVALKLARMRQGYHEDSIIDLINYTAILNKLEKMSCEQTKSQ